VDPKEILKNAKTVLVVDWPSKEVPELLVRAGFPVVVRGGPRPTDYSVYELRDGDVVARHTGRPPECADLVYSYRPLSELPEIIVAALDLHARSIWTQSGLSAAGINDPRGCWVPEEELRSAKALVREAGLNYISRPYIGDVVREIRAAD
jgi:predicted CoA-binding protein